MPSPQWRTDASVIDQLLVEPHRFEFFQAVRLIEMWLRQHGVEHDLPLPDFIQFRNSLSLAFPPSEIAALTPVSDHAVRDAASLLLALRAQQLEHISIVPAFMGLLGGNGTLPYHYTERIATQEQQDGDQGPRAFLDVLSHRALSLFYQAWSKHRPECMTDAHGQDLFLQKLLSLAGVPPSIHTALEAETIACYAVQARSRTVSPAVMAGVLAEHFGAPFTLEQLIGHWQPMRQEHQTLLGRGNCTLEQDTVLGERLYRADARVRLRIGPLAKADFERFLPGCSGALSLRAMLGMHCGIGMAFEVQLILARQDIATARLVPSGITGSAKLGVDAYMLDSPTARDRGDAGYLLQL